MKSVVLLGSARDKGNTFTVIEYLAKFLAFDVIDLKKKNIGHYDYEHKNQADDFLPIIRQITDNYDRIIIATPVYWYSMSSHMKVFFDRITDCLTIEKEMGRKLRGKSMVSLSCSNGDDLPSYFENPFRDTAGYLGMTYEGHFHTWIDNKLEDEVKELLKISLSP